MSSLFSHAVPAPEENGPVPAPRRAAVAVPCDAADAFEGFTENIHLWWPMEEISVTGHGSHVGFENGQLVEESDRGQEHLWAMVKGWESAQWIELAWQLEGDPLNPTLVKVSFDPAEGGGTAVELVQDGWKSGQAGIDQYAQYCDWPLILARYARFMGAAPSLD
ncbi:SRPBCC domain-containing protein [Arthrobacter sp. 35W]|uniref:SRPBCC domain-containing protein n=1 Tax=Arthrobacter sp. 35W TaxID=1132441 RepID=UPI00047D3DD1|nr:SRPBCC domain-containing protein [Arthrobacter sp. 35W]